MNEIGEYEIIFIPEEGRAILNTKTKKVYYSEFQIIEEKNKEIERLKEKLKNLNGELNRYKSMVWLCEKVKDSDKE